MEFILEDTDIFDINICDKVEQLITENNLVNDGGSWFNLEVTFNVELLKRKEWKEYCLKYMPHKYSIHTKNDSKENYISDLLSYVISNITDIFKKYNFNLDQVSIGGDILDSLNIIKISISNSDVKIKDKEKHWTVCSIKPSNLYIQEHMRKIVSEKLNKRFDDYIKIVGDPKIMAHILDIPDVTDLEKLFKEFVKQYAHLFKFHLEGEEDELHKAISKKAEEVYNKYYKDTKN